MRADMPLGCSHPHPIALQGAICGQWPGFEPIGLPGRLMRREKGGVHAHHRDRSNRLCHHVAVRRWSASGPVVRALQHRPQRLQLLFLPAMHGFGIWRWRCLRSEFFRDAVFGRQGRAQELPAPLLRDCSFEPGVARSRLTERPGGHRTAVPSPPDPRPSSQETPLPPAGFLFLPLLLMSFKPASPSSERFQSMPVPRARCATPLMDLRA